MKRWRTFWQAWMQLLNPMVMFVVVIKIVLGLLAALIPLAGGLVLGVPLGWVAAKSSKD